MTNAILLHRRGAFAALPLLAALSACGPVTMVAASLMSPPRVETLPLAGEARPLVVLDLAGTTPQQAVVFITGSGCTGQALYLPGYLKGVSAPARVFALEKPGVGVRDTGLTGCSAMFHTRHTFHTRLADTRTLIDHVAALGFSRIGLVGVSEGAPVAVAAALADRRIDAVLALAAGPMDNRTALSILADAGHLPAGTTRKEVEAALARIAADPTSATQRFLGQSHVWWASQDAAPDAARWAGFDRPLILAVGSDDRNWPPQAARDVATRAAGRANITVTIVAGADHRLIGPAGDAKPEVFRQFLSAF
jgi:dienelactone hydrolase